MEVEVEAMAVWLGDRGPHLRLVRVPKRGCRRAPRRGHLVGQQVHRPPPVRTAAVRMAAQEACRTYRWWPRLVMGHSAQRVSAKCSIRSKLACACRDGTNTQRGSCGRAVTRKRGQRKIANRVRCLVCRSATRPTLRPHDEA
eukprot:scaffold60866_cov48-Phaeocystis_antarctica.AAC.1